MDYHSTEQATYTITLPIARVLDLHLGHDELLPTTGDRDATPSVAPGAYATLLNMLLVCQFFHSFPIPLLIEL